MSTRVGEESEIGASLELGEECAASLEIRGPGIERTLEVAVEIFERHGNGWTRVSKSDASAPGPNSNNLHFSLSSNHGSHRLRQAQDRRSQPRCMYLQHRSIRCS